jgi:hypothetical protein
LIARGAVWLPATIGGNELATGCALFARDSTGGCGMAAAEFAESPSRVVLEEEIVVTISEVTLLSIRGLAMV